MMTNEQFDNWIAELRNPEKKQGKGILYLRERYCCLGVLCETLGLDVKVPVSLVSNKYSELSSPEEWGRASGVRWGPQVLFNSVTLTQRQELSNKNDEGQSFLEIADYLEEHRSEYVQSS